MTDNKVLCKICNVRDLQTAELCAQLGADFVGLHAIRKVKDEDLLNYEAIVKKLSKDYRHTGIVAVTRQQDISTVVEICETVKPTHVQLHASWSADSISNLKSELKKRGYHEIQLIGVVGLLEEPIERVNEVSRMVDLLLIDSSLRGGTGLSTSLALIHDAINLVKPFPVIVAGGLNPDNVRLCIETLHPFAVDVQTGVEYPNRPGVKDPARLTAFLEAVKG